MAESSATLAAQIAQIDIAIAAVSTSQSYGENGRNVNRASADSLFKRRDQLERRYERALQFEAGYDGRFARQRNTGLGQS